MTHPPDDTSCSFCRKPVPLYDQAILMSRGRDGAWQLLVAHLECKQALWAAAMLDKCQPRPPERDVGAPV